MIERAVRAAEEDAHAPGLSARVDTLCLVNILSIPPKGLPSELSRRLGATPTHEAYTWVGATAPQWFVNRTAERIALGNARLALICGGEAFYSAKLKARLAGKGPWDWRFPPRLPGMTGDLRDPLTPLELRYGLTLPLHMYPLMENALRYHEGLGIEAHRREVAEFCAGFSAVAARNPYAWFKEPKSAAEILALSEENRMASFPYSKSMCSVMEVDQSAALFMTDDATAGKLGVPRENRIYLLGSGDASDIWHVTERPRLHESPSVRVAADRAMEQAGAALGDIRYLDFYSCFPCAPRITRNMLGLARDDERPLTVTGGMPYFGGPGNNYALHAICRMAEILRREPDELGLVQALSWFISKHSVGIYSGRPGSMPWRPNPPESHPDAGKEWTGPRMLEAASGKGVVESYMLFHDRRGLPTGGVAVGRLEDQSRFLARVEEDPELLRSMMTEEFIGKSGKVRREKDLNVLQF
jgi:acetyl-CoA C-acetyltransferase